MSTIGKGDKVVLVDARWPDRAKSLYQSFPVVGPVYAVREAFESYGLDEATMDLRLVPAVTLLLVGIINPTNGAGKERGFDAKRFRKLDELEAHEADSYGGWTEPNKAVEAGKELAER